MLEGKTYSFVFTGEGGSAPVPTSPNQTALDAVISSPNNGGGDWATGVGRKVTHSIEQVALSPLNSATGGLASPAYRLGKSIMTGAGKAAIGGAAAGLVIMAVQYGFLKLEERVKKLESKADEANNRDNLLLRAGAVSQATQYERNGLSGIRAVNRG